MPNFLTAKSLAEFGLREIGAFPTTATQAKAGELQVALQYLELILDDEIGGRPLAGYWGTIDIPLVADQADYPTEDYATADQVAHIFSISSVDDGGHTNCLPIEYESQGNSENLEDTGTPLRCVVTRDKKPIVRVFPKPTQDDVDAGRTLRLRVQTYSQAIDQRGITDINVGLRPTWYWWAIKKLAYAIGSGPVRRLGEGELKRFQDDYTTLGSKLLARDGQTNTSQPPLTEPWDM